MRAQGQHISAIGAVYVEIGNLIGSLDELSNDDLYLIENFCQNAWAGWGKEAGIRSAMANVMTMLGPEDSTGPNTHDDAGAAQEKLILQAIECRDVEALESALAVLQPKAVKA